MSIDIGPSGGPADVINFVQVRGWRQNFNTQNHRVRAGGNIDALAHVTAHAAPSSSMQTQDLLTAFTNIPPATGVCVAGPGGTTWRFTQREECAAWATGSNHLTVTSERGFITMDSLSVDDSSDEPAQLTLMHTALTNDDGDDPYVFTDSVDFSSAPAAAFTSLYYLGGVYHNSTLLEGLISVDINFGISVVAKRQNPGVFPKVAYINDRNPEIRLKFEKLNEVSGLAPHGSAVNTEFAVYFQRAVASDDRVAVGTASHLKLSFASGKIENENIGGDAANDADTSLLVRPTSALAINTGSTIPSS